MQSAQKYERVITYDSQCDSMFQNDDLISTSLIKLNNQNRTVGVLHELYFLYHW